MEGVEKDDLDLLLDKEGLKESDVKSVKIWQTMKGETRYSVVLKESTDNIKELKEDLLKCIEDRSPFTPRWDYRENEMKDPVALEVSLPDFHYGRLSDKSLKKSEDDFAWCLQELVEKAQGLQIEKIILPIGNDGMNSEGMRKSTTRGTPQHDIVGWQESFVGYWELIVNAVKYLNNIAPVELVVVQGNHDYERMFYAGEVLNAWFKEDENVSVDNNGDPRKYCEYGVNMLMFTHGDKEKPADMPLIMATEQPEMFARTEFREVHCGHFHKEMVNEYRGIKVRFLPSICSQDEWHKIMGYQNLRCAQAHIWNKKRGYEGYLQVNV